MPKNKIIFQLTRADVVQCINNLDLPYQCDAEGTVTDDFLDRVKKGVEFGLECWDEVMRTAVIDTLEEQHNHYQPLLIKSALVNRN